MMLISNQINAQEESIEKLSKPWLKTSVMPFFRYVFKFIKFFLNQVVCYESEKNFP